MTQRQLERELARTTGESISTIRQRGFSLVEPPDMEPLVVDWDALEVERWTNSPSPDRRRTAA
jgi:hypothetical protein